MAKHPDPVSGSKDQRALKESSSRLPYAIAVVAGTLLWIATSALSGKTEPWDSSIYWTVSYPAAVAFAGFLGYLFPQRSWRWAVALIFMQAAVMVVAGSGFGLLPLGLIFLAFLALPAIAAAWLGAKIRLHGDPA